MSASDAAAQVPLGDPSASKGAGLTSASFLGLLATQALGAANDNIFRWLVIGIGKQYVDAANISNVLMAGTASFVLPYLLFAAHAGSLADRFSKRSVIVVCKAAEIAIMALGVLAIFVGSFWLLLAVLAMMGTQSALFGPSKLGSIPEIVRPERLSAANGMMGLCTVVATVAGMAIGNILTDATGKFGQEKWWLSAVVLLSIAVAGWLASLTIQHLPAADPARHFPWSPLSVLREVWRDLRRLTETTPLLRVALGMMFFWSLAGLAQLNIDQFAFEGGASRQQDVVGLLVALVVGVGLGNVLAGIWSGDRVELGILPLGAGGIALSSLLLFTVEGTLINPSAEFTWSYLAACFFLFTLGISAGLFDVPLNAYMQHRSPVETRGSILAASNFLVFAGILLTSILFAGLRAPVIEGSLANVPAAETPLDQELETKVRDFERLQGAPGQTESPPAVVERFVNELPPGDPRRETLFAHLVWTSNRWQLERGEFIDVDAWEDRFPAYKPLFRQVNLEAVGHPLFSARQIFLICAIATVPVFIYIVCIIPYASIRFVVWLLTHTIYRVRVYDRVNLPATGGALLVANHISWVDGVLLLVTSSRPIRMLIWGDLVKKGVMRWLAQIAGAIPITPSPKAARAALEEARQAILNGELVCIFPEGALTRSGQLQAFKPGMMQIVKDTGAPVIPIYLDELWGSIFSFQGGKFFWKRPQRLPYPVSIWFGRPLVDVNDVRSVRAAVEALGAHAVKTRFDRAMLLPRRMLRMCRKRRFRLKAVDSSGAELTGGALLMRTLILRRLLLRDVLGRDEQFVGILIPPAAGGVVVNAAVTLARRIAANLNYTVSNQVMNACIDQAKIRHVLTSRKVMEKFDFQIEAELVYAEDLKSKITLADKLIAALQAFVVPIWLLERQLGLLQTKADDVQTVIFTSGSTGQPKGVLLSYRNILSNVEAIDQVVHLRNDDLIIGILPFFHSFGYTVTLWTVLGLNIAGAYHFTPLDPKQVGKLCQKHKGTVLLCTPTFLRTYLRRCTKEELGSLEVVVVGAEKMPIELAEEFEQKFGVRPIEGYGATELSPLVSVNVPPSRSLTDDVDLKEGTVGRPVPGVSAKIANPDTFADAPAGAEGMLMITGPNVMLGYHGQPEKTAEVLKDGWYVTGDIATIDPDGFITITGRQSRFSKIGGEMVPHVRIEEELQKAVAELAPKQLAANTDGKADAALDQVTLAVTAVPDSKKGERIIVLYTQVPSDPDTINRRLSQAGLPNLWIPSGDSYFQVDQIPVLGTGKLDLRSLKQTAEKLATGE